MKGKNLLAGTMFFTASLLYGCLSSDHPENGPLISQGTITGTGIWNDSTQQRGWFIEAAVFLTTSSDTTKDRIYIRKNGNEDWFIPPHRWYPSSDHLFVEIFGENLNGYDYKFALYH